MAQIELTATHMLIQLTPAEKFFGLHGDFKIPAALIKGAEVAHKEVWKTLGLRLPGTGIPAMLAYGSFWRGGSKAGGPGGWTFALWRTSSPAISLTLATKKAGTSPANKYSRLVIAVENPQILADTINDAILAC